MPVFALGDNLAFPPPRLAEPSGLLAIGGDLRRERLLRAYRSGIFPWYSEGDPILWFSPDPRFVLFPDRLRVTDSLRRVIRTGRFQVTLDRAFRDVMTGCRDVPRRGQDGTWITADILDAYCELHRAGHAHSVEVWQDRELVGGLYGVCVGRCFCGESMFARVSNASKVGFVWLTERLARAGCRMIDCQVETGHLASFGAEPVRRTDFLRRLRACRDETMDLRGIV